MKRLVMGLVATISATVCASCSALPQVTFEYFNLSSNEVWVTDVIGLPPNATPGRLMPSRDESSLNAHSATYFETVRIRPKIKILWKDGGAQGWPGGLKPNELVPPGVTHEAEFKRDDLGIPAKLSSGKIRFTYLGSEKWHIRLDK